MTTDLQAAVAAMRRLDGADLIALALEVRRSRHAMMRGGRVEDFVYGLGVLARELRMDHEVAWAHLQAGEHPLICGKAQESFGGRDNLCWARSDVEAFKAGELS